MRRIKDIPISTIVTDLASATVLTLYALIIGPLGVLRGPLAIERVGWYLWVLVPQGLLARAIRTAIDWRFGNFDAAIAQLEGLVGTSEEGIKERPASRARRRVLEDFYTVLARAYLHAGHIDDAMLVVIRAKKSLGIQRLSGMAELDAKTAHLVRAGLAAGRLLEGGGLATMFVRSSQQETPVPADKPRPAKDRQDRQGASRERGGQLAGQDSGKPPVSGEGAALGGAKIIQFPAPQPAVPPGQ